MPVPLELLPMAPPAEAELPIELPLPIEVAPPVPLEL